MTYQTFKNGDEIRSFKVDNGKVFTTIIWNDCKVTNPTLEQFYSIGWEDYEYPAPKPYIPTIEELVESAIRNGLEEDAYAIHYSQNQEFHINRIMTKEVKTEADWIKWKAYNDFVERCITWARTQPHRED